MSAATSDVARRLGQAFCRQHPAQAVTVLERLDPAEIVDLLRDLSPAESAGALRHLSPDPAGRVLETLEKATAGRVVEALDPALAARLVARLDRVERTALLKSVQAQRAAELKQLMAFPPHTAGGLMDPNALALPVTTTVGDTLERLRASRDKRILRLFLVDAESKLVGSLSIRDLALAEPQARLDELDVRPPVAVHAMASHEEVVETLARAGVSSLPVVDLDGHVLGVLRHDELVKATRADATADIQSMVGAGKEERALSKVSFAVRKRLPWLQINLLTAFLAASVVALFETTIATYTALAVLLPVVAGQSGNTGAQALAVTMRGLALREIRTRQWMRVCFKEAKVGALNGVAVAITTSLGVLVWSRSPGLALIIGTSMVLSMVAAGLSGAAVPLVLVSLKQDPAQSSSIILTTITDVVGFFSFLGIATLFIGML